jgi:hypothetical protein
MRPVISATSLRECEEKCAAILWRRGGNTGGDDVVACHDAADFGEVGWVVGAEDAGEFEEVLRAEEAGRKKADDASGGLLIVEVGVDGSARDVELLAGMKGEAALVDEPGSDAVHGKDGFVGFAVKVSEVEMSVRRDDELEEVRSAVGLMMALEKGDGEFADFDGVVHRSLSRLDETDGFSGLLVYDTDFGKRLR